MDSRKSAERPVLRPSLLAFSAAATAATVLMIASAITFGEQKLNETVAINQWLARDVASQFAGVSDRLIASAKRFVERVSPESGAFDGMARFEFEAHQGLKAVWVLDATGAAVPNPLGRLERDGFALTDVQAGMVARLVETAVVEGVGVAGLSAELNVVAAKIGDLPRAVLLFFDETMFIQLGGGSASGGPLGDKWVLMKPAADQTEAVLYESQVEQPSANRFPSFDEISRIVIEQSPIQERSEFSTEFNAATGAVYQVSGVRTGAFGVMAVAISPLENSFSSLSVLARVAFGVVIVITLSVALIQLLRERVSRRRNKTVETSSQAETM
ncbi:MAG: hypothetical protein RBT63_01600 [Bdellovibrionales bacterium]|nr:hypothetical protein [Bdellovibrionales bacterium]